MTDLEYREMAKNISVKREPGGHVVTGVNVAKGNDNSVWIQGYVQPDGSIVFERAFTVVK